MKRSRKTPQMGHSEEPGRCFIYITDFILEYQIPLIPSSENALRPARLLALGALCVDPSGSPRPPDFRLRLPVIYSCWTVWHLVFVRDVTSTPQRQKNVLNTKMELRFR